MELRRALALLTLYRWQLVVIPLVAALVGFGASFLVAPRYVATATLQIIPAEVEPRTVTLRSQDGPPSVALGLQDPTELLSRSILEDLASRELSQRIVARLGPATAVPMEGLAALKSGLRRLADDAWTWLRFGYLAPADERTARQEAIRGALSGQSVRGSYYLRIAAAWTEAETAAQIANTAVDELIRYKQQVAVAAASERRRFLELQVLDAQRRVEAARAAMLSQTSASDVVTGESVRLAVGAIDEAQTSLRESEHTLAAARRRLAVVEEQLRATSPEVQTVQVATDRVGAQPSSQVRTTMPNPVYQALQERLLALQQEVAGLVANQEQLRAQIAAREQDLRRLVTRDSRLAALGQELAVASDAYSRRSASWSDAMLEEARPLGQLRLIDSAVAPTYPAWPIKIYWLLIGAAAGLLAVVGLIVVDQMITGAPRSAAEAEATLSLRLLAVVPTDRPQRRRGITRLIGGGQA